MGVAAKDDDKAITETRKFFLDTSVAIGLSLKSALQPPYPPSLSQFGTSQISWETS